MIIFGFRGMTTQQTIISGIKRLLYKHDFLVVPGFGGFVLKSSPSRFHANGMIFPPMKTVGFNVRLLQDDGILRSWLVSELKCEASEAGEHLKDFADYCNTLLKARKRFEMPEIGLFYLNLEGQISFEPISQQNFLTDSFGLQPVTANRLPQITPPIQHERALKFEDRPAPAITKQKRSKSRFYIASIALSALFIALLSMLLNSKVNGPIMAALFNKQAHASYHEMVYPPLSLKDRSKQSIGFTADHSGLATLDCFNLTIPVQVDVPTNEPAELLSKQEGRYELVAGCFSIRANALKMVNKLTSEGIKAAISSKQQKGMYVVTAGSYIDHITAEKAKEQHQSLLKHSWIRVTE